MVLFRQIHQVPIVSPDMSLTKIFAIGVVGGAIAAVIRPQETRRALETLRVTGLDSLIEGAALKQLPAFNDSGSPNTEE